MEYPLTPSQMVFYPKGLPGEETMWNQGIAPIFCQKYSYEQLNNSFNYLIEHHNELRLQIRMEDGQPITYIADFQYVKYPFFEFSSREEVIQAAYRFYESTNPPLRSAFPLCSISCGGLLRVASCFPSPDH